MFKPVSNPPQKFSRQVLEWLDEVPRAKLDVFEEEARSVISRNQSPDLGFSYSVNPYRGCFHACAYCYARPSHQYLDFGAGSDFETKIIVKTNAAEVLERELWHKKWNGDVLMFSGNTDCYQPLEASYEETRKCLEVCLRFKNPVTITTKGALVARDVELLRELSAVTQVSVWISLAFCDDATARLIEPHAPRPSTRLRAMKTLASAGVSVNLALAPIIPGLNDSDIPQIIEQAQQCGAGAAFMTLLRLPAEVGPVFQERLQHAFPERAEKILNGIRAMKQGELNRSAFGERFVGEGPRWEAVRWMFYSSCEKFGLRTEGSGDIYGSTQGVKTFRRPEEQMELFSV